MIAVSVERILIIQAWLLALSVAAIGWTPYNQHCLFVIAESWVPALGAWQ